ncbi:MAG: DUF4190 domain-containing protein [Flavobacteriales bacterium]|nr:hypothetical protein [Flavobacteriales bacterium]MBX2959525.1 DUF4190 domain-containing protein [Flavobacteriales bacterium]
MKKIVWGTLGLFVGSLLLVSCSSESNVLSSFSKRKYLKNFKETKKSYEVVTEEETAQLEEIKTQEIVAETASLNTPIIEENNVELTPETVNLSNVVTPKKVTKQIEKEYRNWDKLTHDNIPSLLASNNTSDFSNLFILKENSSEPRTHWSAIVSLVLGILGGFGGLIFGVIALIAINSKPEKHKGKGLAIAGIILSLLFIILILALMA